MVFAAKREPQLYTLFEIFILLIVYLQTFKKYP